jgi:hypothetical protein
MLATESSAHHESFLIVYILLYAIAPVLRHYKARSHPINIFIIYIIGSALVEMARAFHFPVLAVICVLILGLVGSANAEMGNGTVVAGAGLRSARCTYTWWSNCQ